MRRFLLTYEAEPMHLCVDNSSQQSELFWRIQISGDPGVQENV